MLGVSRTVAKCQKMSRNDENCPKLLKISKTLKIVENCQKNVVKPWCPEGSEPPPKNIKPHLQYSTPTWVGNIQPPPTHWQLPNFPPKKIPRSMYGNPHLMKTNLPTPTSPAVLAKVSTQTMMGYKKSKKSRKNQNWTHQVKSELIPKRHFSYFGLFWIFSWLFWVAFSYTKIQLYVNKCYLT